MRARVDARASPWHESATVEERAPAGGYDAAWLFTAALVTYVLTSPDATAYDQYARFAQAMLDGSLSLPQRPAHLEMAELDGRAYFTNPPTPALILLPLVWLAQFEPLHAWLVRFEGGWGLPLGHIQTAVCIAMGALNVALARLALGRAVSRRAANWGAVLFGFGSIAWYHATIGSVWYFAQIAHATFMWLCVLEWLGKQRPFLMGLALAAAFWCRMETILVVPFVLVACPEKWLRPRADEIIPRPRWGWLVAYGTPLAGVLLLNAGYNWVRFGTIENWGYRMLIEKPEVAPMYPYGLLSIHYWRGHFDVFFRAWPIFLDEFPWVAPSVGGTAIWATTPAFIYAFRAPWDRWTAGCWLGIALFTALLIQHCGTGMTQLGYRFAMDFYPLLVLLTIRGMDRPIRWWHMGLITLSVFINTWYVWVLNILHVEKLF